MPQADVTTVNTRGVDCAEVDIGFGRGIRPTDSLNLTSWLNLSIGSRSMAKT